MSQIQLNFDNLAFYSMHPFQGLGNIDKGYIKRIFKGKSYHILIPEAAVQFSWFFPNFPQFYVVTFNVRIN